MPETKMLVMLGQGKTIAQRKDLFRALDETIMDELSRGKLNQEVAKILRSMTTDERRAVMLTAIEGFSIFETAEILCTSTSFVEEALTNAETSLQSALATTVLVIEDEILIAERLADIALADGSSGAEAVAGIQASLPRPVPVIFITAFPKRLLTGENSEPAFLIPKPFLPCQVRTMVEQADMTAYLDEPH
jgi:CheY-like chemotaxis protein